uniref:Uncharacterized protein n=1 Tax=Panagrolaimus sp. ES5 TaxID=591445 RepID=A0AC34F9U6_9BILA
MSFLYHSDLSSTFKNISLNDSKFAEIYENTKETNKFLAYFQQCLRELNPHNYNGTIHLNIRTMVDMMIEKRRMLLSEYYRLKEKNDKNKVGADEGKCRKLEAQIRQLMNNLNAEKMANGKLNENNIRMQNEYANKSQQLQNQITSLQKNLKCSEDKNEQLKDALDHSVKQNLDLLEQIKIEKEENEMLNQRVDCLNRFDASFSKCRNESLAKDKIIKKNQVEIDQKNEIINEKNKVVAELTVQIEELREELTAAIINFDASNPNIDETSNKAAPESSEMNPLPSTISQFSPIVESESSSKSTSSEPPNKRPKNTANVAIKQALENPLFPFSNSAPSIRPSMFQQSFGNPEHEFIPTTFADPANQYYIPQHPQYQFYTPSPYSFPFTNALNQENYGYQFPSIHDQQNDTQTHNFNNLKKS